MMRHLSTLVLSAILGSIVLVGNVQACHRNKCTGGCGTAVCPPLCVKPAPCFQPVAARCKPKLNLCFKISLPKLFHKRCAPCGTHTVATACPTGACYRSAAPVAYQPIPSPQASGQH
jgi:hypothetical protein